MNYDDKRLLELGEGAILHDVGKILVREVVLKKPGKLTDDEYEEIKLHAKLGFETIHSCYSLSKNVAYIANTHHERMNGKGYPFGLVGDEIQEIARIVAIADVYDALVSDRIYRAKMFPGEVIDYIVFRESGYFDEEIMKVFTKYLAVFPVGTHVLLSNNIRGIVVKDNPKTPYKPSVKVVGQQINVQTNDTKMEEILDLSENINIYIAKAVDVC
jgi:HD-GYP domain-containing protein (c-di-GMP phosphodiesterase class II)